MALSCRFRILLMGKPGTALVYFEKLSRNRSCDSAKHLIP